MLEPLVNLRVFSEPFVEIVSLVTFNTAAVEGGEIMWEEALKRDPVVRCSCRGWGEGGRNVSCSLIMHCEG